MSENDYIAEYIKERYPEILETCEFASWKLNAALKELAREAAEGIAAAFAKFDFKKLLDPLEKAKLAFNEIFEEKIKEENNMSLQDLQEELYILHQMRKNGSISEEESQFVHFQPLIAKKEGGE